MNAVATPMTEHSTDFELMFETLSYIADDELSGVQVRPAPPPVAEEPEVEERLLPGAFTQAFMEKVPGMKLGRKFWNPKSDDRHAELREKRKAERKARKKNRRNR